MRRWAVVAVLLAACGAAEEPPLPRPPAARPPAAEPPPIVVAAPATSASSFSSAPVAEPTPPPAPPKPKLFVQGYWVFVWPKPKADGRYLGALRVGTSVTLRSTEIVKGEKCSGGFYEVEPRGYVCNSTKVTRAPDERFRELSSAIAASRDGVLPFRYALSNGAPMYSRVPTEKEQKKIENKFGKASKWQHLSRGLSAYEERAFYEPIDATGDMPALFANGQAAFSERTSLVNDEIPLGSTLSFTSVFAANGRSFLVSADGTLVPSDRVRVFKPSEFHGTKLGEGVDLPIAWMKKTPKQKWRKKADGSFEATGTSWPARSFVGVTAGAESGFVATSEKDTDGSALYVAEKDATIVEAREDLPFKVGEHDTWILVKIGEGTLVAYEGKKPVYATLVSVGKGGVPIPGGDPVANATTPTGTWKLTWKDRATTMSPDKDGAKHTFFIADVPYTQYFDPPFALHAAFWHERFGEPASAGCINVAPIDAKFLFDWSEPRVPEEWQAATGAGASENGDATWIVVKR